MNAQDIGLCESLQPASSMVLVIDDDPAVRGALQFSLEIEGFSVRCYASPAEFLAASDLPGRACLVVDQNLPGISGLDMIDRLPLEHKLNMPAVLITSYPSRTMRNRACAAGVPIVEKPLMGSSLSDAILKALAPKRCD